jgi:hypothetical protein
VKPPELVSGATQAFLPFALQYERYCKRLFDIAERHKTTVLPKPSID